MNEEGLFPRLLELLQARNRKEKEEVPAGLHRLLMDLMYEMSRIQRVKIEDLGALCLGYIGPVVWFVLLTEGWQFSWMTNSSRASLISLRISRTMSMILIIIRLFVCW